MRKKYVRPKSLIQIKCHQYEYQYCRRIMTGYSAILEREPAEINIALFAAVIAQKGYTKQNYYVMPEGTEKNQASYDIRLPDESFVNSVNRVMDIVEAANGYRRRVDSLIHVLRFFTLDFENLRSINLVESISVIKNIDKYIEIKEVLG